MIDTYSPMMLIALTLISTPGMFVSSTDLVLAQSTTACPASVLSRLVTQRTVSGDTLEKLAERYSLTQATLMGLNPALRSGRVVGVSEIIIAPFNGIRVRVPVGKTLQDLATQYKVRPDLLFELNGCQPAPREVFIPGAVWTPQVEQASSIDRPQLRYPLPQRSTITLNFGFQAQSAVQVAAHSGVDLAASIGTPVLAAAAGTVSFASMQGSWGNLVVINHAQGYQTRYAQLKSFSVKRGQVVKAGQAIATVGVSGTPSSKTPHLHFEVRSNSNQGWLAEDPTFYLMQKPLTQISK